MIGIIIFEIVHKEAKDKATQISINFIIHAILLYNMYICSLGGGHFAFACSSASLVISVYMYHQSGKQLSVRAHEGASGCMGEIHIWQLLIDLSRSQLGGR